MRFYRLFFRRHSEAFTLIELLAVLAIIIALAAIIIPAMTHVRKGARLAECASNLRQIVNAANLFANDHSGRLPVTRNAAMGSFAANAATPHDGGLITALAFYSSGGEKIFYCPEASPSGYTYEVQSRKSGTRGTSSGPYWQMGYYWLASLDGVFSEKPAFPLLAAEEPRRVLASCIYFGGTLPHENRLNIAHADGAISTVSKSLDRAVNPATLLPR